MKIKDNNLFVFDLSEKEEYSLRIMGEFEPSLIQKAGPDFVLRRKDSPVFKMSNGVFETFAVLGALIEVDGEKVVNGISFMVDGGGGQCDLMGQITLEELYSGELLTKSQVVWKLEFDGLASDEKHKDKKWSFWS